MKKRDLVIPEEMIEKAGFESDNLVAVVENGLIRIVEDDEEYCRGFFIIEEETIVHKKAVPQPPKEVLILSKKGTVYLPVDIRRLVGFEIGSVLELSIVEEGMLIKKIMI